MYPMLVAIAIIVATSVPLIFLPGNDADMKPYGNQNVKYLVYPLVAI